MPESLPLPDGMRTAQSPDFVHRTRSPRTRLLIFWLAKFYHPSAPTHPNRAQHAALETVHQNTSSIYYRALDLLLSASMRFRE
jgi:hypothetical protein